MLIKESDFAVVHWAPFFLLKLCYTSQTYSNTSEQAAQYSQIMHENGLFSHRVVSEVGEKVLPSHLLCWNSLWPWDEYFNDEKHKFNYIELFPLCTFYCTCSILHWRSKKKNASCWFSTSIWDIWWHSETSQPYSENDFFHTSHEGFSSLLV